jgi:autotransporter family porin
MNPGKHARATRPVRLLLAVTALPLALTACGLAGPAHPARDTVRPAGSVHLAVHPATRHRVTAPGAPKFFRTRPPGAALPSSAQCAAWVRAIPVPAENKHMNGPFNHRTGERLPARFLSGDAPGADQKIVPRVNGNFTGTTRQILRWAACKWGISQTIVFAQAAKESWWRQTTKGDYHNDPTSCPPGHRTLNQQGNCAQSYGILQNRYPFEKGSWPGIYRSTAMNADTAYAIWRACYDGYETWLNTVPHNGTYAKGDAWGCVGRWFSGRWHDAAAQQYIGLVRQYRRQKIWMTRDFQEP